MRQAPADRHGLRLRALIVVLWRGGLRIQEALSLIESDLDPRRASILVRKGKGNRRREVGLDAWAWSDHIAPWLACRVELPLGALFCVIDGPTRGRPLSATAARAKLRGYALAAGVRRRFAPHQLRTSAPASSSEPSRRPSSMWREHRAALPPRRRGRALPL